MRKAIVLTAIIAALGTCTIFAGTASAATSNSSTATSTPSPAFVVNHGQQVGDNCIATVGTAVYTGYITHLVGTSSGLFNLGCQLWGPPVAQTMNFNGLMVDPSGHAVLSENGVA
jgi:hypothetical protein